MRREGKHPLSKVPHLGDPELDAYATSGGARTGSSGEGGEACSSSSSSSSADGTTTAATATAAAAEEAEQQPGETNEAYLVRTCRYCRQERESQELEQLLHCDGIWLHALRYQGRDWAFQAPLPPWAEHASFRAPIA